MKEMVQKGYKLHEFPRGISDPIASGISLQGEKGFERPSPLRFWEIDDFFRCPIVGACLDISEQEKILKQAGISTKRRSHFEIHEMTIENSRFEGAVSTKIERLFKRKFNNEVLTLFDIEEDQFMELWNSCSKRGETEGMLWVAAVRADLSMEARRSIFGDIHIDMHKGARQHKDDRKRLASQKEQNQKLAEKLREINKKRVGKGQEGTGQGTERSHRKMHFT